MCHMMIEEGGAVSGPIKSSPWLHQGDLWLSSFSVTQPRPFPLSPWCLSFPSFPTMTVSAPFTNHFSHHPGPVSTISHPPWPRISEDSTCPLFFLVHTSPWVSYNMGWGSGVGDATTQSCLFSFHHWMSLPWPSSQIGNNSSVVFTRMLFPVHQKSFLYPDECHFLLGGII